MAEVFTINHDAADIGLGLESDFGNLDEFSTADDLNRLLNELCQAGVLECPKGLEIMVYPSAVEESDVALITVFSISNPNAHVVAGSEAMRKLATIDPADGADDGTLTAGIIDGAIGLANCAVAAVRELEGRSARRRVVAAARCPRCGEQGCLRFEYRFDLLGLTLDRTPVLAEGGELTEIFCLACGDEVDKVLGPDGPVAC